MISRDMENEIVSGLIDIFENNISSIVLYGSVARGEENTDSDIDIAIILHNSMSESDRSLFVKLFADLDIKHDRVFSVIDIDESIYEKWSDILPFYKNIKNEGIVLWKAA